MKKNVFRFLAFAISFIVVFWLMINSKENTMSNGELSFKWGVLSFMYSPLIIIVLLIVIIVLLLRKNKK